MIWTFSWKMCYAPPVSHRLCVSAMRCLVDMTRQGRYGSAQKSIPSLQPVTWSRNSVGVNVCELLPLNDLLIALNPSYADPDERSLLVTRGESDHNPSTDSSNFHVLAEAETRRSSLWTSCFLEHFSQSRETSYRLVRGKDWTFNRNIIRSNWQNIRQAIDQILNDIKMIGPDDRLQLRPRRSPFIRLIHALHRPRCMVSINPAISSPGGTVSCKARGRSSCFLWSWNYGGVLTIMALYRSLSMAWNTLYICQTFSRRCICLQRVTWILLHSSHLAYIQSSPDVDSHQSSWDNNCQCKTRILNHVSIVIKIDFYYHHSSKGSYAGLFKYGIWRCYAIFVINNFCVMP